MHLRSRHVNKSKGKSVRYLASRISAEESVTQRVGLETIVEDTSNVWSTTKKSSMASQGSKKFLNARTAIKYNMTFKYYVENVHGTKIDVNPLGQFVVRIDDHEIES